jgi:hypothetical protein
LENIVDKEKLKTMRKFLEETRNKVDKPNLSNMLKEIKELMEALVLMQYMDKLTELKALLQPSENSKKEETQDPENIQEKISNTEKQNFIDRSADKFEQAMKELDSIATRKGLEHLILYRPTADLEYAACKDGAKSMYNTTALDNGKGMETVWYLSVKGADHGRIEKNPLVQAIIPKKSISGFLFPPNVESGSTGSQIDDKWLDIIQVKVDPGSFEVVSEYLGDW